MKKIGLIAFLLCLFSNASFAQKFAFIDTEYILSQIDDFKANEEKIEARVAEYQKEITQLTEEVQNLYKVYQEKAEKMNENQRKSEEKAIMKKEQKAMELGRSYFGPEGSVADLRSKLLDPFYDKIYEAAKLIATKYDYAAIIDRATASSIIFALPQYDISNEILSTMGYSK